MRWSLFSFTEKYSGGRRFKMVIGCKGGSKKREVTAVGMA